jgi:hypothetical protein
MRKDEHPAVKNAKTLCLFVLLGAIALLALSSKVPALWAFANSQAGWVCAGIAAGIVALVALRAALISR